MGRNVPDKAILVESSHVERMKLAFITLTEPKSTYFVAMESLSRMCNVATPSSGLNLWWTRHPHVHLAASAQPLFVPRGI
ncbi:hypothetical protein TNCV_4033691 [Trichonephila clavipes]|nr:hypothetical protein TNCV_4033691 [Trichonephila clavipes]